MFRSLAKEGRHLVIGFASGSIPSLPANLPLLKSASLVGVTIRHFLASQPVKAQEVRTGLFECVVSGTLRAPTVPLKHWRPPCSGTRPGRSLCFQLARPLIH